MKTRRLLIIGTIPPPIGGVSIHILRLSRHLAAQDIAHTIVDQSRNEKPGVISLRKLSFFRFVGLVSRFDVVHIHSSNHLVRLAHTLLARCLGKRVVHTVHSARGSGVALAALKVGTWLGQRRIAVSDAVAERLSGKSDVIPAFVPPGAEDEALDPVIAAWIDGQAAQGRRVIAANAYNPSKIDGVDLYGLDMVVEAFANPAIRDTCSAIVCVSVPQTPDGHFEALAARIEAMGVGDRVWLLTGQVAFSGVLMKSDVFVRPTITDGDALSVREAIWYGVPAIASDASYRPPEAIVFASRDQAGFDAAILNAPPRRESGGGENFAVKVETVLRDVMGTS